MSNTSPGHLVPGHVTEIIADLYLALQKTAASTDPCVYMLRKGLEYLIECLEDCLLNQYSAYYYNFIERTLRQVYTIERMAYGSYDSIEIDKSAIDAIVKTLTETSSHLHNAHLEISTQIMSTMPEVVTKVREFQPL